MDFKEAPADTMEWHPELPSIIKVVDKKTKENLQIKLNTKGMGIFHFGNAFEIVAGSYSKIELSQKISVIYHPTSYSRNK